MAVLKPEAFHGDAKKGPYFEGWYFKNIAPGGEKRWSVIPGVYIGKHPQDSHSFIQFMNGATGESWYLDFPYEDFQADNERFDVRVGQNEFSGSHLLLNIDRQDFSASGRLDFQDTNPWPVTVFSPGIMGWFAWLPGMECYHGVVSLDHPITGELTINGETIDFSGGRGYMEKDWGQAMPKVWIWSQTNHFKQPGVSLTLSVAEIPFGPLTFNGFIVGLLLNGELHKFATYTGARIEKLALDDGQVEIVFADRRKRLEISARRGRASSLQAPTVSQMDRRIMETLSAEIHVTFSIKQSGRWQVVFEDTGKYAGLEIVGELDPDKF